MQDVVPAAWISSQGKPKDDFHWLSESEITSELDTEQSEEVLRILTEMNQDFFNKYDRITL